MAATSQEKFEAAVKVIRGLPKNGSFQPSHELMLKFYAYYKQATEGPCTSAKPGIWNIVSRKKWEAWAELGQMERETAMLHYVEELKNVSKHVRDTLYPPEIVETMPQTEHVADFVSTLGAFYELVDEGSKDFIKHSAGKAGTQLNGSTVNGEGDDQFDHSASIGEMLRINNNDTKKGRGDHGDSFDKDKAVVPNGVTTNGHRDTTDEDEEDDNSVEEEEEEAEEFDKGLEESTRLDSGSDSEEFCDTSDQMIPTKLGGLQAGPPLMSTSTPVDGKRETRVRFAPNVVMADDDRASVGSYGNGLDRSAALRDISNLSAELMSERLGLGSTTGLSFLPGTVEFPPHKLTGSLQVNNSYSSLTTLAGDSAAAEEVEEGDDLDAKDLTFSGNSDMVAMRGGGQDDAMSTQATQGSICSGRGNSSSSWSSRNYSQNAGGSARRGLFPSGSGSGGSRRGGDGRQMSGSLDEQILLTLIRLQQDMTDISNRLASLELTVKLQREEQGKHAVKESEWWPFPGMSKKMAFILVVWPFLAPLIISLIRSRRRPSPS